MATLAGTGDFFFEMAGDASAILENGQFIRVNHAWEGIIGRRPEDLLGRHWMYLFDTESAERIVEAMARAASGEGRFSGVEAGVRDASGREHLLVWSGYTDSGRWLLSARDDTEQRLAQEKMRLQAQLRDAVEAAVVASDFDGRIIEWSAGAERMLGWCAEEVVGDRMLAQTVSSQNAENADRILRSIQQNQRWEGELEARRKDGSSFPAWVRCTLYQSEGGAPVGFVGVVVDLTEQAKAKRDLEVAHDYLRAVTENMAEALCTVSEVGHLRYMNRAAEELLGWRREEAIGQSPHELFHRGRTDGSPHPPEECPLVPAPGSGAPVRVEDDVFIRKDGSEVEVAYSATSSKAEVGGRDLVVVIRDISERRARERELAARLDSMTWVGRIRDALAEERFRVFVQPILDLRTGEVCQHELLVRMLGQDDSIIPPADFLPAAEEYLLIREIDDWMVSQASRLAAQGHPVSVNLSAQSVVADGMIEHIRSELGRAAANPQLLSVEITETAFLTDEHAARRFLEQLGELGCRVALDDFGTGYGGLSYLKRLPVDCLKIDQEFVQDVATDRASRHVVEAVVSLAQGFGQLTVAEGAEDEQTCEQLRRLRVDCVQGYAVGTPQPVEAAFEAA
jgi:PAS domain S-box-containing protein